MLLKYFYDPDLAHASYLIGCQKSGEALVVDPGRNVEPYIRAAKKEGLRIVAAAETHIHADFVSGARELAEKHGAKLYLSDTGPAEWKYLFAKDYEHLGLRDGDQFSLGKIEFSVRHTPGHTPESISLVVTDRGGGANEPIGVFTGDFVFVGSVGRPDLLETAVGVEGSADAGARDMFRSLRWFLELPDHIQVWPAHGAGSACGKGLGSIPSSTVGYERRFNPALQIRDENDFVEYLLADQPETPRYFALMKRLNREGPNLLDASAMPPRLDANEVTTAANSGVVIDTSSPAQFARGFVANTINMSRRHLAQWAGSILDPEQSISLLTTEDALPAIVHLLQKIGFEKFAGYFDSQQVSELGRKTETMERFTPAQVAETQADIQLIDVRGNTERCQASIPQAESIFLGDLPERLDSIPSDKPIVFHCKGGGRSVVAASLALRNGMQPVADMLGGIDRWIEEGRAVDQAETKGCQA